MALGVMWLMTAMVIGFMLGRVSMYGQMEEPEETEPDREGQAPVQSRVFLRRGKGHRIEEAAFWPVGSPVSGVVMAQQEGEHPVIMIYPEDDCLYAPAAGKVTKLFPMGNAFLLTTDFGTEIYIQVGDVSDELMVRHYRPRIVQNEIVGKGKLLLEFDRQGLEADGASAEVSVCVENCPYGSGVKMVAGEWVRIGEEIFQVQESSVQEAQFRYRAFD